LSSRIAACGAHEQNWYAELRNYYPRIRWQFSAESLGEEQDRHPERERSEAEAIPSVARP